MKLYCECFAAKVECGKNCHCLDCHNKTGSDHTHSHFNHMNQPDNIIMSYSNGQIDRKNTL